jgi:hypothetical protein
MFDPPCKGRTFNADVKELKGIILESKQRK